MKLCCLQCKQSGKKLKCLYKIFVYLIHRTKIAMKAIRGITDAPTKSADIVV